jgi:hypothetical protein
MAPPRWLRRFRGTFAVLSLTLSLAMLALWVVSYYRLDVVSRAIVDGAAHDGREREWFLYSNYGRLYYGHNDQRYRYTFDPNPPGRSGYGWNGGTPRANFLVGVADNQGWGFNFAGVGYGVVTIPAKPTLDGSWASRKHVGVLVPHWLMAAVFALGAVPGVVRWARHRRVARRIRTHHCATCGYDVRATPQRCPECGNDSPLAPT